MKPNQSSLYLSAAYLVKRSALQLNKFYRDTLKYKNNNKIIVDHFSKLPSEDQLEGNKKALAKAQSPYLEMQSIFARYDKNLETNLKIYFTVDEIVVKKNRFYLLEHKWLKDPNNYEDWFFKQSLIQTAFLRALSHYSKDFATASFFEGEKFNLTLPKTYYSRLVFGDTTYSVTCDNLQVMRFFLTKARVITNYERARRFDGVFRKREWSYFQDKISYRKIKTRD